MLRHAHIARRVRRANWSHRISEAAAVVTFRTPSVVTLDSSASARLPQNGTAYRYRVRVYRNYNNTSTMIVECSYSRVSHRLPVRRQYRKERTALTVQAYRGYAISFQATNTTTKSRKSASQSPEGSINHLYLDGFNDYQFD